MRELAEQPVPAPRGLASRVLARLQRERGRGDVEIAAGECGRDTVSVAVLAQVARRAAASVEGVRQVSVVAEAVPADGSGERPADDPAIDVHLIASLGPSLPELADEVRAAVAERLSTLAGVRVARVDVTVDDVV